MAITTEVLLAPLGRTLSSAPLAEVASALGEQPEEVDGSMVFPRAGLAYWAHQDTGVVTTVFWPVTAAGATTVPFPRGITAEMGDLAVRQLLGRPTTTPLGTDFYGGALPHDIFDLDQVTIQVAYDETCTRVIGVMMGTAQTQAALRARRASSAAAIRRAKGGPTMFSEVLAQLEAAPRRDEPLAAVVALLAHNPAKDLAALMRAHAEHAHRPLHVGDYNLEEGGFEENIPGPGGEGSRDDRLCIGLTGGGDLWVVPWPPTGGETTPVSLLVHDDDWLEQEDSDSLEEFFHRLEENA